MGLRDRNGFESAVAHVGECLKVGCEVRQLSVGGGDYRGKALYRWRDALGRFGDTGHGLLGVFRGLHRLFVELVELVKLVTVLLLPLDELLNGGIEGFEVLAELLRQVLVEVRNHLLQCLDDLFRRRLRELLTEVV